MGIKSESETAKSLSGARSYPLHNLLCEWMNRLSPRAIEDPDKLLLKTESGLRITGLARLRRPIKNSLRGVFDLTRMG